MTLPGDVAAVAAALAANAPPDPTELAAVIDDDVLAGLGEHFYTLVADLDRGPARRFGIRLCDVLAAGGRPDDDAAIGQVEVVLAAMELDDGDGPERAVDVDPGPDRGRARRVPGAGASSDEHALETVAGLSPPPTSSSAMRP